MLNPSTADEAVDDPTIARCLRRAGKLGFSRLIVTNLFAFRSTNPANLFQAEDPVGPDNDRWLMEVAKGSDMVICGWGNHGTYMKRSESVASRLRRAGVKLHALKITAVGEPTHPLYVPYAAFPTTWQ